MLNLIPLLLVPLVVLLLMKAASHKGFTWQEFALLEGAMTIVLVIGFFVARYEAMADVEIWSGHITSKTKGTEHCCHCRSVCDRRDKKGNCTSSHQECDHVHDYWWQLDVSTGDRIHDGCNASSGAPAWWRSAFVGDTAAMPHSFTNYLLADPSSVFNDRGEEEDYVDVPPYPSVYRKYKIDNTIALDVKMPLVGWNRRLMELNDELGHDKQVHIVVIGTQRANPEFADHIDEAWLGGKKNTLAFVFGAPGGRHISWARIISFSEVPELEIATREAFVGMEIDDVEGVSSKIRELTLAHFHRTPMAEYAYLASAASPSNFSMTLLYLLALALSVGGAKVMEAYDLFGEDRYRRRY